MKAITRMWIAAIISLECSAFKEEHCVPLGEKTCVEQGNRDVDGFRVNRCWKYEQQFKCISQEENHCAAFESNRGCRETKAECKEESLGKCKRFEKQFICGGKTPENKEVKLVEAEFNVLKDEKDLSKCSDQEINKLCKIANETCVEGAETRNINGKDVYKDCWKWEREYDCRSDTKIDECVDLRNDKTCKEVSRECVHFEAGVCEHYVIKYDCEHSSTQKADCISAEFCIGGVCKEQERSTNQNFGKAISALNVLAQVKKDGEGCSCYDEPDEKDKDKTSENSYEDDSNKKDSSKRNCKDNPVSADTCKLFKGEAKKCLKNFQYNCCSDRGFVKKLIGCSAEAQDLQLKEKAGVCHFTGSYKSRWRKVWSRVNSYCCFNSKLARIIQVEGRKQLGIGWGDRKSPVCRALTLAEIQRIDFSKIDFSELYNELKQKAEKEFADNFSQDKAKEKVEELKNQKLQGGISEKFKKFYGQQD